MDGFPSLDALVAPLRNDVRSGATDVTAAAARIVALAARTLPARTLNEFRECLTLVACAVLDAQPAMAPLVALTARVLETAEGLDDVASARRACERAAHDFAAKLEQATDRVAAAAAALLPPAGKILTLSASSTVLAALCRMAAPAAGVVVLEGRPGLEGRRMATELADKGMPVTLAVDAAGATLAARSDAVLLGADSVGDAGVVNKLGSLAAARGARDAGVPVLVVAAWTKILPPGFPQPLGDDRPPGDVWEHSGPVRVWNQYFEAVPLAMVTRFVTDDGTFTPEELATARGTVHVPDAVGAWGARRAREAADWSNPW